MSVISCNNVTQKYLYVLYQQIIKFPYIISQYTSFLELGEIITLSKPQADLTVNVKANMSKLHFNLNTLQQTLKLSILGYDGYTGYTYEIYITSFITHAELCLPNTAVNICLSCTSHNPIKIIVSV